MGHLEVHTAEVAEAFWLLLFCLPPFHFHPHSLTGPPPLGLMLDSWTASPLAPTTSFSLSSFWLVLLPITPCEVGEWLTGFLAEGDLRSCR